MRKNLVAVVIVSTSAAIGASAWAKDPAPPSKPAIPVVRDLTLLPTGKYRMVQSWDSKGSELSEHGGGAKSETKAIASSNKLSFAVEIQGAVAGAEKKAGDVAAKDRRLKVVVSRVEIRVDDADPTPLKYDSAGPVDKQSDYLLRQFRTLIGAASIAGAVAFSDGTGFAGLNAVWETLETQQPDLSRAAQVNLNNYGDARLDRMFSQGLDALFGSEAGRAKGLTRTLSLGDEFVSKVERSGIAMKPTTVDLACKVISIARGEVVVRSEWKINGFDPTTDGGGLKVRGADIHGVATLTFLAQGGLLTRLEETLDRTDQISPGPTRGVTQWTRRVTEHRTFSFVKE